ncbi:hypothetical protein ABIE50_002701 [Chitinophaga sp. OAE865]
MWIKPATLSPAKDLPEGNGYDIIAGLGVYYNSYPIKKRTLKHLFTSSILQRIKTPVIDH